MQTDTFPRVLNQIFAQNLTFSQLVKNGTQTSIHIFVEYKSLNDTRQTPGDEGQRQTTRCSTRDREQVFTY